MVCTKVINNLNPKPGRPAALHTALPLPLQVICTKVRDGDKRIVRLKEGEPRGRHVVIVDDLVQSGSTLIECQKLLASQVRGPQSPPVLLRTKVRMHLSD